jgi:malonyl-CoA/methylmalonyl-CoA synthetase
LIDGGEPARVLDAGALDSLTARLASDLAARGVEPGDRVLWCARATLESVPALLAVLRAGAVLVTVSPSARDPEVAHVVRDARAEVALCDHDRAMGPEVAALDIGAFVAGAAARAVERDRAEALPSLHPDDDALIVYTSGTTGAPKGAVHTHGSLLAGATSLITAWGWTPDDRLLLCLPLFHVHGLCAGLFGTLTAGGSALLFDRFDETAVLASAPSCTMFFGVPTMYHRLAATDRVGELAGMRLCVSGSAPLAADLWRRLALDGLEILERYGMTETLLTLSNPLAGERRPGSVGVPLPSVEAEVRDPDSQGVGELFVRGPMLCRGYWGRGAPRADGWFATGDLASVADDGYVTIRGRRTELIITGGHNVYPAEVEAVLARHPGVSDVAVVGVPSEEWGETVVAFVVGEPDLAALEAHAAAELAPFKCPRQVRLVETLPRNALGKVVRSRLR